MNDSDLADREYEPTLRSSDLPHSEEAEAHILACCLLDEGATLTRAIKDGVTPTAFYLPKNRAIFETLGQMLQSGKAIGLEILGPELGERLTSVGGYPYLIQITSDIPTTAHAGYFIEKLKELEIRRTLIREAKILIEKATNGTALPELSAQAEWAIKPLLIPKADSGELLKSLLALRVTASVEPAEPTTRLFLAGKAIATPGNITTFTSRSKTGKTAATGAATASIIAASLGLKDQDTFGFTASNPAGHAVIVTDTEQSKYDAYLCYKRTLFRAGTEIDPSWLFHFSLVGKSPAEIRAALPVLFAHAKAQCGGIYIHVLDGVADLALSVNDEAEAKVIATELRSLSIQYDCPILAVIHSNEAVKAGDDARGHLGKELMRKAESNLLLKKSGEVTTITSEKQRKAPITEADGIAFKWSDAEQRHVSCLSGNNAKDGAKLDRSLELAEAVFEHLAKPRAKYTEVVKAIETIRNVGGKRAEERFTEMKKLGVICKDMMGFWSIIP